MRVLSKFIKKTKGPNNSSQPVEDRYSSSWPTRRSGKNDSQKYRNGLFAVLISSFLGMGIDESQSKYQSKIEWDLTNGSPTDP